MAQPQEVYRHAQELSAVEFHLLWNLELFAACHFQGPYLSLTCHFQNTTFDQCLQATCHPVTTCHYLGPPPAATSSRFPGSRGFNHELKVRRLLGNKLNLKRLHAKSCAVQFEAIKVVSTPGKSQRPELAL